MLAKGKQLVDDAVDAGMTAMSFQADPQVRHSSPSAVTRRCVTARCGCVAALRIAVSRVTALQGHHSRGCRNLTPQLTLTLQRRRQSLALSVTHVSLTPTPSPQVLTQELIDYAKGRGLEEPVSLVRTGFAAASALAGKRTTDGLYCCRCPPDPH